MQAKMAGHGNGGEIKKEKSIVHSLSTSKLHSVTLTCIFSLVKLQKMSEHFKASLIEEALVSSSLYLND